MNMTEDFTDDVVVEEIKKQIDNADMKEDEKKEDVVKVWYSLTDGNLLMFILLFRDD